MHLPLLWLVATLAACGDDGAPDAGELDAGAVDAGAVDAGAVDAGSADAGPPPDAGAPPDAGPPGDAGAPAAGWPVPLPFGVFGSPRLLAAPGAGDPWLAFGWGNEIAGGGAVAIDPTDGSERFRHETDQELFSVTLVLPPSGDTPERWVFGGRNATLTAIDPATGEPVWTFAPAGDEARAVGLFNFYTGLVVDDVDGDGLEDLLIPNGGDHRALPDDPRTTGFLMVLSGADGSILEQAAVPDGRETYCSLVRLDRGGVPWVLFGTGGETMPGNLYAVPLADAVAGDLSSATALLEDSVPGKGIVGPPSLADLNDDGQLDVVVAAFDGRVRALDGATLEELWRHDVDGHETNASPAIGDVDGDGDPDVFTGRHRGVWPMLDDSLLVAFDGATGEVLYEERVPLVALASPLMADVDGDGRAEVLQTLSSTDFFMGMPGDTQWAVVHVDERRVEVLASMLGVAGSAGLVADTDGDDHLEWLIPMNSFMGGSLVRLDFAADAPARVDWGGYLGTDHDGAHRP